MKPSTTIIQQRLAAASTEQLLVGAQSGDDALEHDDADDVIAPEKVSRPKSKTARKPTTPDVLDMDADAEASLKAFADQHSGVDSDVERYLVIAAWFKEHRETPAVTTAHIYTGLRMMSWPTAIEDFGGILRYLKKQKLMTSGNRGEYLINHLGLAKVKKLAGS
ncbi:MAG: hypothetical protein EOO77_45865 [Oxalobacteraceae bacterium]|nr:MAG: hypothetical protein EOO77_45865 [Oxalobacteraceae bacterium]